MTTITEETGARIVATTDTTPTSNTPTSGVMHEAAYVLTSVQLTVANTFDLLALETRRASFTLTWMFALGLVAAILTLTAWAGLMTVIALSAVAWGLSWIGAILLMVMFNLCAALAVVFVCQKVSRNLLFSASRRQFAMRLLAQSSSI